MGSPDDDKEAREDEKPQHRVRISRPFYLGLYEVTQAQYKAVMGVNPSSFSSTGRLKSSVAGRSTDLHPVETVCWLDAVRFCNKLSTMDGVRPFYELDGDAVRVPERSGAGYRLPTEAEWEYACRARTKTRWSFGDGDASATEFGWFDGTSDNRTHPVGEKRPNGFGLFDMHGNVREWCWDSFDVMYYGKSTMVDPRARRVLTPGGPRGRLGLGARQRQVGVPGLVRAGRPIHPPGLSPCPGTVWALSKARIRLCDRGPAPTRRFPAKGLAGCSAPAVAGARWRRTGMTY